MRNTSKTHTYRTDEFRAGNFLRSHSCFVPLAHIPNYSSSHHLNMLSASLFTPCERTFVKVSKQERRTILSFWMREQPVAPPCGAAGETTPRNTIGLTEVIMLIRRGGGAGICYVKVADSPHLHWEEGALVKALSRPGANNSSSS